MTTINSQNNNEFELHNLAQPVNMNKKKDDTEAELAHLSTLIEEVLASITPSANTTTSSKIVHPNFNASRANQNNGPSNAQMQAAYSALVGLLASLQGDIAKYSNKIANFNADVGKALMEDMQGQFKQTIKELDKIAKEQADASWWSKFTKWIEGIVAAIGMVVATLCGQPELALVIFAFTTLSLSGGMEKITQGIADLISKALVADGVSKEEADKIAKVLADIIVVVATIVVTALTCGAGAAEAVETTVDESIEGGIELTNFGAEETLSTTAEEVESNSQKLLNFLKDNNPFSKLSRAKNFALLTGSMSVGGTNLGHDIMAAACSKMAEGKDKETLITAMSVIFGLITALAGAGASIALAAGPESESALNSVLKNIATKMKTFLETQEFNLSTALRTLMAIQVAGATIDASGKVATSVVNVELAETIKEQGVTQALLSELQALTRMNSEQSSTNSKALASEMKTWGSEIAVLGEKLNELQGAVARELQAQ